MSFAQEKKYSLTGEVIDTNAQLILTGDVFLLHPVDSVLIKHNPILNGKFSFDLIPEGNYILKVISMGFSNELKNIRLSGNENVRILLKENMILLNEVRVTTIERPFTYTDGNIKMNVENSIFSSISNPMDLLAQLPTVSINPNSESINIIGRGTPLIYMDNQRLSLIDLNSLSVKDIKSIEIIENPSNKYEANGSTVILITRRVNKNESSLDVSQTSLYRKFYNNLTGMNLNLRMKKLEIRSNLQYNQLSVWESNASNFLITNEGLQSSYDLECITKRPQFVGGIGAFYQINDNEYFSVNVIGRYQDESFPIYTDSYSKTAAMENTVYTENLNKEKRTFFSSRFNYNKKFKKGEQLFLGAQYSGYRRQLASNIWNNYDATITELSQSRNQKSTINVVTGRIDFEKLIKSVKLEIGLNGSSPVSLATLDIRDYNPSDQTSSIYNYTEKYYAGYSQVSTTAGKLSFLAGFRLENTLIEGGLRDNALSVNKNLLYFFPKGQISFNIDSNSNFNFSFAKTIIRPDYSSVSQITTYINPFFEWASNINLTPTINTELAAKLQSKSNSLKLSYIRKKNPVYAGFQYNSTNTRLTRTDFNYDYESSIRLNLSISESHKGWTSSNVITSGITNVKDVSLVAFKVKPWLYAFSNHQFKMPKEFIWSITGWGITKTNKGITVQNSVYSVNSALSKTFFKKLNCTLGINNILKSMTSKESFLINDIVAESVYYDAREVSLAVKYSFGNIINSKFKNKEVDDNTNRIR